MGDWYDFTLLICFNSVDIVFLFLDSMDVCVLVVDWFVLIGSGCFVLIVFAGCDLVFWTLLTSWLWLCVLLCLWLWLAGVDGLVVACICIGLVVVIDVMFGCCGVWVDCGLWLLIVLPAGGLLVVGLC